MPVYKKKADSPNSKLRWDGYLFSKDALTHTKKYVAPHADLELVADTPFPDNYITLATTHTFEAGTPTVEVEIPACGHFFITIRAAAGKISFQEQSLDNPVAELEYQEYYLPPFPLEYGRVTKYFISGETGAVAFILVERVD